jgi:hypothetical protein
VMVLINILNLFVLFFMTSVRELNSNTVYVLSVCEFYVYLTSYTSDNSRMKVQKKFEFQLAFPLLLFNLYFLKSF